MKEKVRLQSVLMVCVTICLLLSSTVVATAEPSLIEPDEPVPSFRTLSGIQQILPRSPYRAGDVGSGGDYWAAITSQYNQPRGESGTTRIHRGVDLRSTVGGVVTPRPLFATMANSTVWFVHTDLASSGGLGRFVVMQNVHFDNGLEYHFQTMYAHLSSVNVSVGQSVSPTTPIIGRTGGSGTTESSYPIHLHMEKLTPTTTQGTWGTRRYPPSFFYWQVPAGTWGSDTSFINRSATSGNTVNFRILDIAGANNPRDVPQSNVGLFFRSAGASSWAGVFGNMSKSENNFSFAFTGHPAGTIIEYYVQVRSNTWDGTLRTASRPYRYSDGRAPTTRPLRHTMVANPTAMAVPESGVEYLEYGHQAALNEADLSSQNAVLDYIGAVVIEQIVDGSTFVAREVTGWTSVGEVVLGGQITLRISDISGLGNIVIGTEYRVIGQVTSRHPLTVTLSQADGIRANVSYGGQ